MSAPPTYWLFSWTVVSAPPTYWLFSWTAVSAPPTYWLFSWTALSTLPAVTVQLNCCVCATGLLTVCHLNFFVRATSLSKLWSREICVKVLSFEVLIQRRKHFYSRLYSPSFKYLFFNLDPCQNFPLSTIFCSSLSVYISHKFRYCKHSVHLYYRTWFLLLLAWTKTLSSQEAIRVIKCLHAG